MDDHLNNNVGIGLRSIHTQDVMKGKHPIPWFEIISENFTTAQGISRNNISKIRENHPVAMHGVSLSLGSKLDYQKKHLEDLANLVIELEPFIVSDHLCWTGSQKHTSYDLLPIELNLESFKLVKSNILRVQDKLKRQLVIENISQYVQFKTSDIPETDFINSLCKETDCGILLDINNVYVNSVNFNFDPHQYIDSINKNSVKQYHLAGHTPIQKNDDFFLFDTHIGPTPDSVLNLYKYTLQKIGPKPALIEWDADIPPFNEMITEWEKTQGIHNEYARNLS